MLNLIQYRQSGYSIPSIGRLIQERMQPSHGFDERSYPRKAGWNHVGFEPRHEYIARIIKKHGGKNLKSLNEIAYMLGWTASNKVMPGLHTAVGQRARKCWKDVVWAEESWADDSCGSRTMHFCHVAEGDPNQVAFTPDEKYLIADRQVRMKPGRYLMKFFGPESEKPVLTEAQCKAWATKQIAAGQPAELHLIPNTDPDGWVWVYESSYPSCMRYNRSDRYLDYGCDGENHPVRCYAHPENDLALAFTMLPSEAYDRDVVCDKDAFIVEARCIVNVKDLTYHRLYGRSEENKARLQESLEKAGYCKSGSVLEGQKLQLLENDDGVTLCPYLDGHYSNVEFYDDYLLIVSSGGKDGQNSNGLLDAPSYYCPCCGGHVYGEDDLTYVECRDESICGECLDDRYVLAHARHGEEYIHKDDAVMYESAWYHRDYLSYHDLFICEDCDEVFSTDECNGSCSGEDLCDCCSATDAVTDKVYRVSETSESDLDGVVFDDALVGTMTGETAHKERCYKLIRPDGVEVYVHADQIEAPDVAGEFARWGDHLVPAGISGYHGEPITEAFSPCNLFDGSATASHGRHVIEDHWEFPEVAVPVALASPAQLEERIAT